VAGDLVEPLSFVGYAGAMELYAPAM